MTQLIALIISIAIMFLILGAVVFDKDVDIGLQVAMTIVIVFFSIFITITVFKKIKPIDTPKAPAMERAWHDER